MVCVSIFPSITTFTISLKDSLDAVEEMLKKQSELEKMLKRQDEKFKLLERETKIERLEREKIEAEERKIRDEREARIREEQKRLEEIKRKEEVCQLLSARFSETINFYYFTKERIKEEERIRMEEERLRKEEEEKQKEQEMIRLKVNAKYIV